MLQIVYGPAGSGKTQYLRQRIRAGMERERTSYLLVPEQFSLYTEKELINRFGLPAQTKVKVLTFSRLCNLVLRRLGPLRMQYMDGAGKQIVAARTLAVLKGKLDLLEPNLRQKGFSQIVVSTISEMKRYGVEPETLRQAGERSNKPEFARKLKDLALIYETFQQLLERQSADAEDNLALICPRLKECTFLDGALYIQHFRSFTPIEYRVLGQLMHHMDVYALFVCSREEDNAGLFAPVLDAVRILKETAREEDIPVLPDISLTAKAPDKPFGLTHLQAQFFAPRPRPYAGIPQDVHTIRVRSQFREVEAAADLILRLCREKGWRYSDFLVLAREPGTYQRILPAVFGKRGIRVFLDTRRSILTKPVTRMFCGVLDCLAYGVSYDRIMAIARSGLTDCGLSHVDLLENYLLASAPSHAMWQKEAWDYNPGGQYDMEIINNARRSVLEGVTAMQRHISGTKTAGELCAALLDWIQDAGLAERLSRVMEEHSSHGRPELAEECRQVWNAILSVLAQISAIMGSEPMTYAAFAELFRSACGGIQVGLIPQTLDSVVFSAIDRFRSSGPRTVLVLGVSEGIFPKAHTAEGLISDPERQELLDMGIRLAPGMDAKRREEQLLIYTVLTAPREQLYLFTPLADADGRIQTPSSIVKRLESQLFPAMAPEDPDKDGDALHGAEGPESAFELVAAALAGAQGDPQRMEPVMKQVYDAFEANPDFAFRLEHVRQGMADLTPRPLSRDMVARLYGRPISLSASRLEKYNACAFQYFINYGLLAREREKAGVEPAGMGSVQHAALYDYFTWLKEKGVDYNAVTKEDCFARVARAVDREAKKNAQLLYESSAYYKYIVLRMQGIASRTAWEVIKFYQSSRFRPYGFELTIGTGGPIPVLSVKGPGGEEIARIRGLIDRADTAQDGEETYVSVVDYKSSQKTLDAALVRDGIQIQPLLYTGAVCGVIKHARPAAMVYMQMTDPIVDGDKLKSQEQLEDEIHKQIKLGGWMVDDPKVAARYGTGKGGESFVPGGRTALISRKEMDQRMEAANRKIQESAREITEGNISPSPYRENGHDACQYCDFLGICQRRD